MQDELAVSNGFEENKDYIILYDDPLGDGAFGICYLAYRTPVPQTDPAGDVNKETVLVFCVKEVRFLPD